MFFYLGRLVEYSNTRRSTSPLKQAEAYITGRFRLKTEAPRKFGWLGFRHVSNPGHLTRNACCGAAEALVIIRIFLASGTARYKKRNAPMRRVPKTTYEFLRELFYSSTSHRNSHRLFGFNVKSLTLMVFDRIRLGFVLVCEHEVIVIGSSIIVG